MAPTTTKRTEVAVISQDLVEQKIHIVRGQKVMLDSDLAELYCVTTSNLNKAVKRSIDRFPDDFRFQVSTKEYDNLRFQIGTSSSRNYGGRRYLPYVFTEQGVAMLSSVLNSDRAVQVNIAIMRAFVNMRKLVATNAGITRKLAAIEKKLRSHDEDLEEVFETIRAMMAPDRESKQIGYIQKKK
jgi:hypothetical protein